MTIGLAGKILSSTAGIGNHYPNRADIDDGLFDQFHGRKDPVDEVAAVGQHLQLPAAIAAGGQKLLRVLEIVMEIRVGRIVGNGRCDDLAFGKRRPSCTVTIPIMSEALSMMTGSKPFRSRISRDMSAKSFCSLALRLNRVGRLRRQHDELG